ncbi:MAG: RNA polymerase sigma-70 factor [Saprospiraceae bacterium]|jgi:RNA polymerase sigma-70 factor (ECF subfamily)|nr:RNA polymerase sigma-70 factor [Saprospiraceae bacterium]
MHTSSEISEAQDLQRLRQGDTQALRRLFDRHYPLLLGDIYAYLPDEDTCKDLAQEVFVELWRKREELDIHTSLRAYLRRAAVNRALNRIKSNRRTMLDDTADRQDQADTSQLDIDQKQEQERLETILHQAIGQLPEKCRLVFSLSRFEHMSHREIAEQLGISTKTIENQITKAMRLLREAMLEHRYLSPVVIWVLKWWGQG